MAFFRSIVDMLAIHLGKPMPVQSRVRPTVTPAAAGPSQAQPPAGGGRLDRKQRTLGNQAVQEQLGLGASESAQENASECGEDYVVDEVSEGVASAQTALRDNTDHASVTVRGRLAKNAGFADADGNGMVGFASTTFEVGVSRTRAWAEFSPELLLMPGGFLEKAATGGIELAALSFDFATGKPSMKYDLGLAGAMLDRFLDVRGEVERVFSEAVRSALPADMTAGGYDPYTDPSLPQRLAAIATALTTGFPSKPQDTGGRGLGADALLARIDQPELEARVNAKAMEVPLDARTKLRLGAGGSLELTARLEGTLGDALAQPTLRELSLATDDLTLEDVDLGLLGGLQLHGLTLGPDLSVRALDYTLGVETALGLARAVGALMNHDVSALAGAGAVESPRLQAVRAQVEAAVRVKLPEMLREQVRNVAAEMPGLPLGELLGPDQG